MLVICSLDFLEAKAFAAMADLVVKFQSLRTDRRQHPFEILAAIVRAMRPHFYPLTHERLEMSQLGQRTIDARRCDLKQVAPLDRVVNVEQIADNRTQHLEVAHRDTTARTIHQQPQQRSPRALAKVDSDQLEAL